MQYEVEDEDVDLQCLPGFLGPGTSHHPSAEKGQLRGRACQKDKQLLNTTTHEGDGMDKADDHRNQQSEFTK